MIHKLSVLGHFKRIADGGKITARTGHYGTAKTRYRALKAKYLVGNLIGGKHTAPGRIYIKAYILDALLYQGINGIFKIVHLKTIKHSLHANVGTATVVLGGNL